MKKITLAVSVASTMMMLSASAFAEDAAPPTDQGHGTIKFVGAIVDSPCSIAPESADQTIQMGQIANSLLESQGEGPLRPFDINLEGCALTTAKTATITFNGIPDSTDKNNLALDGLAKGAAISMVNELDGSKVVLGSATKGATLVKGDNHLKFGAKLVSNLQTGEKAIPGAFTATTNFIIAYQ